MLPSRQNPDVPAGYPDGPDCPYEELEEPDDFSEGNSEEYIEK